LNVKFGPVPIDQAEGKILAHSIAKSIAGHAFHKGKPLHAADIAVLRDHGRKIVFVAELEPGDVDQDEAASRVAQAICGSQLEPSRPVLGRVNIQAQCLGVLHVHLTRLMALNEITGITLATLNSFSLVHPNQPVATLKVIAYALPGSSVRMAESDQPETGPILQIRPLNPQAVAVILCGSAQSRRRVTDSFLPPLQTRLEALNSTINRVSYVNTNDGDLGEGAFVQFLSQAVEAGASLIVLAGEMAILDDRDIIPHAVERLDGEVTCFGVPVDPGALLMLAYLGKIPVLGAPRCARSLELNVLDRVLPRLLSGEQLDRAGILALGHGGLLDSSTQFRSSSTVRPEEE